MKNTNLRLYRVIFKDKYFVQKKRNNKYLDFEVSKNVDVAFLFFSKKYAEETAIVFNGIVETIYLSPKAYDFHYALREDYINKYNDQQRTIEEISLEGTEQHRIFVQMSSP